MDHAPTHVWTVHTLNTYCWLLNCIPGRLYMESALLAKKALASQLQVVVSELRLQFKHFCVGVYVFVNTNRQHSYAVVVACQVKLTEKQRCVELHMHSGSHCINHGASICFLLCYHTLHLLSNKTTTVYNAIVENMLVILPHMHQSMYRCCVIVLINKLLAVCFV
jgi:hypothetical protein